MTLPLAALLQGVAATPPVGEGVAGAIDLDGTNDYLSRSSDLVGNADGKTFTFSAWVWWSKTASSNRVYTMATGASGDERLYLYIDPSNSAFGFLARNSSNVVVLNTLTNIDLKTVNNTFVHILVSIDLSNTTKRHIYLNDSVASSSWSTYTNDNIDFTLPYHRISGDSWNSSYFGGRLSNLYLDYTYRDLSVEANRRYFITADRKPAAGQAALNPIIYLPMDDPATAHVNQGTGGNFTLNGTIARSGRGPNQFNAPYSDLDGSADYLSRTSIAGIADGKQFTLAFSYSKDAGIGNFFIQYFGNPSGSDRFIAYIQSGYRLRVDAYNSSGVLIFRVTCDVGTSVDTNRNTHVSLSVDLSDVNKRSIKINGGANYSYLSWDVYTNDTIDWLPTTNPTACFGANATPGNWFNGRLGNVFFDTRYIDLSVPANLAKFVTGTGIDAKPADLGANGELPFGTPPLIYLPMYGNNAGKNYGTGGDFTVNSGPYPGARGPNEFWGNKADFPSGGTGQLSRATALSGVSNGKVISISMFFTPDTLPASSNWMFPFCIGSYKFAIGADGSNLKILGRNSAGATILDALSVSSAFVNGTTYHVCACVDLSNPSNRVVYKDGVSVSMSWLTYTNDTMQLAVNDTVAIPQNTGYTDLKLSEFYFTTDYIDFSQEANRLLFRDAFGNPTDLPAAIAKGTVPNPAIYMRFDPADQGRNDGTGGNFVKSGVIADAGNL